MGENKMSDVPDSVLLTLQKDVAQIKEALLGSEYTDHKGLIHKQNCTDSNVRDIRDRINKLVWTTVGVSSSVSIVIGLVILIITIVKFGG